MGQHRCTVRPAICMKGERYRLEYKYYGFVSIAAASLL